jgi:hypothetical protein
MQPQQSRLGQKTACVIPEPISEILYVQRRLNPQLVRLAQIFFPRGMHMQQGNDRDVGRGFQLNVISESNQHISCEIPFDSIEKATNLFHKRRIVLLAIAFSAAHHG